MFESPVILPNPDKELDDGGVYKGDTTSDRIRKGTRGLIPSLRETGFIIKIMITNINQINISMYVC